MEDGGSESLWRRIGKSGLRAGEGRSHPRQWRHHQAGEVLLTGYNTRPHPRFHDLRPRSSTAARPIRSCSRWRRSTWRRVAGDELSYPGITNDYRNTHHFRRCCIPAWFGHHTEHRGIRASAADGRRQRMDRPEGYRESSQQKRSRTRLMRNRRRHQQGAMSRGACLCGGENGKPLGRIGWPAITRPAARHRKKQSLSASSRKPSGTERAIPSATEP